MIRNEERSIEMRRDRLSRRFANPPACDARPSIGWDGEIYADEFCWNCQASERRAGAGGMMMSPHMSPEERKLFESFLSCAVNYLEFGAGGSTVLASTKVKGSIISIDSSREWLDRVDKEYKALSAPVHPHLIFTDIGPVGDWGIPSDPAMREYWPRYHSSVWESPSTKEVDLFMVDGRFRVACFLQAIIHGRKDALIAFHDYNSRPHYHVVEKVARVVARSEDLSVFSPLTGARLLASHLLNDWAYEAH